MLGYVYILKDDTGRFYVGSTSDIARRVKQHSASHTQTTARMKNPKTVLVQEYATLETARLVERKLKKLKRRDYIEKIVRDGYIALGA
jgi:predicted GIY-YIG superfamily endonuclease